jgi:Tfp pilus assembly protein PilF
VCLDGGSRPDRHGFLIELLNPIHLGGNVHYFRLLFTTAFMVAPLLAQLGGGSAAAGSLRGEVAYDQPSQAVELNSIIVQIKPLDRNEPARETTVDMRGHFEFREIPAGNYQVTVLNRGGGVLRTDIVNVNAHTGPLNLRLQRQNQPAKHGGVVSLQRLRHKPSKKAWKEYERSGRALEAGDRERSLRHLEKAVELDPQFVAARNNLGSRYLVAGDLERSEIHLAAAVAEDPSCAECQANYAALLLTIRRPVDAERAAARALALNGTSAKSHYLMGLALMQQNKMNAHTRRHLEIGLEEVPKARLLLAEMDWREGRPSEAVAHIELYLKSDRVEQRQQVEAWLSRLRERASLAARGQPAR